MLRLSPILRVLWFVWATLHNRFRRIGLPVYIISRGCTSSQSDSLRGWFLLHSRCTSAVEETYFIASKAHFKEGAEGTGKPWPWNLERHRITRGLNRSGVLTSRSTANYRLSPTKELYRMILNPKIQSYLTGQWVETGCCLVPKNQLLGQNLALQDLLVIPRKAAKANKGGKMRSNCQKSSIWLVQ